MKRVLIFGFNDYYPAGGLEDVIATSDTVADALDFVSELSDKFDHYDILDTFTCRAYDASGNQRDFDYYT